MNSPPDLFRVQGDFQHFVLTETSGIESMMALLPRIAADQAALRAASFLKRWVSDGLLSGFQAGVAVVV